MNASFKLDSLKTAETKGDIYVEYMIITCKGWNNYPKNAAPVECDPAVASLDVGEERRSVRSRFLCTEEETDATASQWSQKTRQYAKTRKTHSNCSYLTVSLFSIAGHINSGKKK